MDENKTDWRMWIGIILIIAGVFYKPGTFNFVTEPKLAEPEAEIVELVKDISISDPTDSSRLAGMFNAMSLLLDKIGLPTNLKVQYFIAHVGKKTFGTDLLSNGKPKYPKFAPAVAKAMTEILGPQTDTSPITADKKRKLARLFYGLSWKIYRAKTDRAYETYKLRAETVINEYNKVKPDEPDAETCPCAATGFIVHGDGHKTPCPCVAGGKQCKHNCKKTTKPPTISKPDKPPSPPKKRAPCSCDTNSTYCICEERFGKCKCNSRHAGGSDSCGRRGVLDWLLRR